MGRVSGRSGAFMTTKPLASPQPGGSWAESANGARFLAGRRQPAPRSPERHARGRPNAHPANEMVGSKAKAPRDGTCPRTSAGGNSQVAIGTELGGRCGWGRGAPHCASHRPISTLLHSPQKGLLRARLRCAVPRPSCPCSSSPCPAPRPRRTSPAALPRRSGPGPMPAPAPAPRPRPALPSAGAPGVWCRCPTKKPTGTGTHPEIESSAGAALCTARFPPRLQPQLPARPRRTWLPRRLAAAPRII